MKRIDIDKKIKAKTIEIAAEKFAKVLSSKGHEWAAEEIVESVKNGYYYFSDASEAIIVKGGRPVAPKSHDWTYYWAIENINGNNWYAWFIEREVT